MTKKKKIILAILLCLTLIIVGCEYSIWSKNKETKKAIAWIEGQGGFVKFSFPEWIEKCPKFSQEFIKSVIGENLTEVQIKGTQVTDISPLKKMTKIQILNLNVTQVNDI